MASDIVLGSALRNNILTIKRVQNTIDEVTLRLATGREVNSALDEPQNYFAAQSLNNKAADLERLLDGLSQDIQTIKQAEIGLNNVSNLVEQAEAISTQAYDLLNTESNQAEVIGDRDLSEVGDLTTLNGINNGDIITIRAREQGVFAASSNESYTINAGDTISDLINDINSRQDILTASLTEEGELSLVAQENQSFRIALAASVAGATADLLLANELGLGEFLDETTLLLGATEQSTVTFSPSQTLRSFEFVNSVTQETAVRSDRLFDLTDENGSLLFSSVVQDGSIDISVNNTEQVSIAVNADVSIQDVIDSINSSSLSNKVRAGFIEETGQLTIRSISIEAEFVTLETVGNTNTSLYDFGFGTFYFFEVGVLSQKNKIYFGTGGSPQINQLENDYNEILNQIDNAIEDTGYRGTNLLAGDDLLSVFNETRSSTLTIEAGTLTSSGLGLSEANFSNQNSALAIIQQTRNATEQIREYAASISNDLNVVQIRQNYTLQTINNLSAGADKLTNSDANKDGAELLASQTRQQMAITALALSRQSQSAILRLF